MHKHDQALIAKDEKLIKEEGSELTNSLNTLSMVQTKSAKDQKEMSDLVKKYRESIANDQKELAAQKTNLEKIIEGKLADEKKKLADLKTKNSQEL